MSIASAFRFALRFVCLASVVLISPVVLAQGDAPAADGFDPNVNGNVYAVAIQPDGKILIAGEFTSLQPAGSAAVARNNIVRLLPTGRVDPTFSGNVNGRIDAMVLQADGRVVIGGRFTSVSGTARNHAARLNADGSLDPAFDPNTGGLTTPATPEVRALAIDSTGGILVGGGFTSVKPNGAATETARNRIARFNADGSFDTAFNPNASGMVLALAVQADGKILVGGGFTSLQPNGASAATTRNRIARLNADGSLDTAFDPNANNSVNAIALQGDGRILIGGSFTALQPNGTDTAVTSAIRFGRLHSNGTVDTTFVGQASGAVDMIVVQPDGSILAGGPFGGLGNSAVTYFARVRPDGTRDTTFNPGVNFSVYAAGVQPDGSIVLGGGFTALTGSGLTSVARNHVARVLPSGGLDADFRPDVNGRLRTVALQSDGKILVGGSFTSVAGFTRDSFVRLDATGRVDTSFTANVNGTVLAALHLADGKILIGGTFSRVNGVPRINIARLNSDGSVDAGYELAVGSAVTSIVQQTDGKILIAGAFTFLRATLAGDVVGRSYLARLNTDGSLDTAFNTRTDKAVHALVLQSDGKILIGGEFTLVQADQDANPTSRFSLARINADGTIDTAFNAGTNGTVSRIVVDPDGRIVAAGSFQQVAGTGASAAIARSNIVRLTPTGAIDEPFNPNVNGAINALARQSDGKLLIAGRFTQVGSGDAAGRNYVARLNTDGTLDPSFDLQVPIAPGNEVVAFAQPGERILMAGAFNIAGTTPTQRLVLLNRDGTLDSSFSTDMSSASGAQIGALALQTDGRVFVGGAFSNVNGNNSTNLGRFFTDASPDTAFVPSPNGPVHAIAQLPTRGDAIPTQRPGLAWLESNGQLRSGISLPADAVLGLVNSVIVQPDGKILFAGDVSVSGVRVGVLRLNANGSLDTSFQLKSSPGVQAMELQSDSKILIGGTFTITDGSVTRSNFARLNADGTVDTTFTQNVSGGVFAIAVQSDNKIIAGGDFFAVQTAPAGTATTNRSRIARFAADGAVDTGFNPNANDAVQRVFVLPDGKILISGPFTTLTPNGATTATSRNTLARLNSDGTVDSIDPSPNGVVLALTRDSAGRFIVGGTFTRIAGQTRNYLARFDSNLVLDTSFNPNPSDYVITIAMQGEKILIGGTFTSLQPNSTSYDPLLAIPRNSAARLNADGTVDATFNPNFNQSVSRIVVLSDGGILANGAFSSIQPNGSLLIGGAFTALNGISVNNLALLGDDSSVSSTFQPEPNGAVHALVALPNGQVIIGGAFTTISGTARNRLARYTADNSLDAGFNPNINGDVYAVVLQPDGKFVVAGSFTSVAGTGRNQIARLNADGSLDLAFNPAGSGAVRVLALQRDGRILHTREAGTASVLSRLNADGSTDGSFAANHNNAVHTVAAQPDGRIIVGGSFTTIGGATRSHLAALTATGSLDTAITAQPNGPVTALIVQPDGKILIAGQFNAVDSLPRFGLARIAAPVPVVQSFALSNGTLTWTRTTGGPEVYAVTFESSSDTITWSTLGQGNRVANTGNWQLSGLSLGAGNHQVRARALIPVTPNSSVGVMDAYAQLYNGSGSGGSNGAPVITSATVVGGTAGTSFFYSIGASGEPTTYAASGLPAGLSVNAATGSISGTPTQTGSFAVTVSATNSVGTGSATVTIVVSATGGGGSSSAHLLNISCLATVTTTRPLIVGFVINGSDPKNVLLRGVGPGLASQQVTGFLPEPRLTLFRGQTSLLQNSKWGGSAELIELFARLGEFPLDPNSTDAAAVTTLSPGPYTVVMTNAGTSSGGSVLAEVYDAGGSPQQFAAMSARGYIEGGSLLIGGFVLTGDTPRRVLIRGVGPVLTKAGVTDQLADPTIKVFSGQQLIAENNDWETPVSGGASAAELVEVTGRVGPAALDAGSKDAAVIVTLAPGIYTAHAGSNGGTGAGTALIEIYEVP